MLEDKLNTFKGTRKQLDGANFSLKIKIKKLNLKFLLSKK